MKTLLAFLAALPLMGWGQPGIKFETSLSWEEVKVKAKSENKYIFLDFYATWCAPCKQMDQAVYSNDSVGDYFNSKFICVKVQMDKTKNDNEWTKSWRTTGLKMSNEYHISVFPSFLFFSPNGTLVHKESGFMGISAFLREAATATMPGKKYEDPYAGYYQWLKDYRGGEKDYAQMPTMITKARSLFQKALADSITQDYYQYLQKSDKKTLSDADNLRFIAANIKSSEDPLYKLFTKDAKQTDALVGQKGFSQTAIDNVIKAEYTNGYLSDFESANNFASIISKSIEPDWNTLETQISQKFGATMAARSIRIAKRQFYFKYKRNHTFSQAYVQTFISSVLEHQDMDTTNHHLDGLFNTWAWEIFTTSKDPKLISLAISKLEGSVLNKPVYKEYACMMMDTYANLLYKQSMLFNSNRFDDALAWENKAVENSRLNNFGTDVLKDTVEKMKKREPTWLEKPEK